jgi:SAM-dependent methyltransferase
MPESLQQALTRLRAMILDDDQLVRAVGTGRRRGQSPPWRRAELRYVDLKSGRQLQVTTYDEAQAHTVNHPLDSAAQAVDEMLDQPFRNWHVETAEQTVQLRVTKKGEALVHSTARAPDAPPPSRQHDRAKSRLLAEDHPMLVALGIADHRGSIKPTRQAKYRQVEEFLRALAAALDDGFACAALRKPTTNDPLRVVDLGCGNAYLTFAAQAYLADVRGLPARVVGVDARGQSRQHNIAVARQLGLDGSMSFLHADIGTVELPDRPDVVLALHACDTATDDAIARAVAWQAPLVMAAPCCHHDIAAQLRASAAPEGYAMLTRDGILRERFAETLTDALRASLLRLAGYRVDVFAFVESKHTPRNTMLRAVRTGRAASEEDRRELDRLTTAWGVRPRLAELLHDG